MYVDLLNGSEIFTNLKSLQGLMPNYNDQTNLIKLACVVNFCRNLGDQSSDILQHSQNRPTGDRWLKF